MTQGFWAQLDPGDVVSVDREGLENLAAELWRQREAGHPWEMALVSQREAYRAFAMLALVELLGGRSNLSGA